MNFLCDFICCLLYPAALQKLNLVNGVLFTGGWCKSGRYREVVEKIFKVIVYLMNFYNDENTYDGLLDYTA